MEFVIILFFFGLFGAMLGKVFKNRPMAGFFLSFFLGPIGWFLILVFESAPDSLNLNVRRLKARPDSLQARPDSLGVRLDSLGVRLDSLGARLDSLGARLERLENGANGDSVSVVGGSTPGGTKSEFPCPVCRSMIDRRSRECHNCHAIITDSDRSRAKRWGGRDFEKLND